LHHGHRIKARCQAFDPQNHCSEIEVGTSYNFTRSIDKRFADLLSLDHPKMTLVVEEEHE
jgi:hypothetical protein